MADLVPSADNVVLEIAGEVGVVTLDRPETRNALTFAMYRRLAAILTHLPRQSGVRAIVVTGAGDKAFAAGTDIAQFREFKTTGDALAYERQIDEVLGAIEACPVPTVAALCGACTGGGAAIAVACDIRLATGDLRFGFPIARTLGNCLSIASLSRVAGVLGAARTREILLSARLIGAEEALAVGLVSETAADRAALIARAMALAQTLAGHAPLTLAATREGLRRLRTQGPAAADEDLIAMCYGSQDFREGLEAFLAKRQPRWTGR